MSHSFSRREFLQQTSTVGAAVATGGLFGCAESKPTSVPAGPSGGEAATADVPEPAGEKETVVADAPIPIVDTHQHLWDLDKLTLPWLKGEAVQSINRSYLPADYAEATKGLNIVKTVYMEVNVEASQQTQEAEYVIALCEDEKNPMAAAVIGGSPQSADFNDYIAPLAKSKYVKGVRTVLHDPDRPPGMCLEPQFVENMKLLGELGLSYDLCMRPAEIGDGAALIRQCPDTRFIIDHCGNMSVVVPDEAEGKEAIAAYRETREKWMQGMQAAAELPNVVCKISGIVVTAKKDAWKPADLAPNIDFCLDTFGEERVFFGGDWPVCTLKASYADWTNALKEIVKDRSPEFQRKLFHDNAVKFYGLA